MVKLWSEAPAARSKELVADIATAAWVSFWAVLAARLYATLSGFAEAGRALQQGGQNLQDVGGTVGDALGALPVVGPGISDLSRSGFQAAGDPFIYVGGELETLLILIAGRSGRWSWRRPSSRGCHAICPGEPVGWPSCATLTAPSAAVRRTSRPPRWIDSSQPEPWIGCPTRRCWPIRPIRSATSPPSATTVWPRPNCPASACCPRPRGVRGERTATNGRPRCDRSRWCAPSVGGWIRGPDAPLPSTCPGALPMLRYRGSAEPRGPSFQGAQRTCGTDRRSRAPFASPSS
jgi:hypothetical protein